MNAEGQLYSQFLDLVHVTDGKADSIVTAIKGVLDKKKFILLLVSHYTW